MRYLLIFFLTVFTAQIAFSQTLQDNFTDGNFSANPIWTGTTADFMVNGANELQTDNLGVSATSELSTIAAIQDSTFWEFYVRMDFSPSTSNYTRVYLQADDATISNTTNGYYLQIGASGSSDSIEIYRVDGGTPTKIFGGMNAAVASNPTVSFRIIRNSIGSWEVFTDYAGGTTYVSEGTFVDATHTTGSHFGFLARYTTTRGDKFFFDNVYVSPLMVDITAPVIDSVAAINATQVDVYFDEIVDLATANTAGNYSINNGVTITSATRDVSNFMLVHLVTSTLTSALTNTITINGVEDLNNNAISNGTANFIYYNVQTAAFQDIIINEIHADPSPVVGLPNAEFVELLNRSNKIIDLGGMLLNDGSDKTLPSFLLFPDSMVVLTASANVSAYTSLGTTIDMGSLTLTNSGELLTFKNASGQTIDSVDYDIAWYQDVVKDDGGWTLELINPNLICQGATNWIASNDVIGGTPGRQNSVYNNTPDVQAPNLMSATFLSSTSVQLIFNEQLDGNTANVVGNYTIGGLTVSAATFTAPSTVILTVSAMTNQTTYTVVVNNVADCSGNAIGANNTAMFTYVTILPAAFQDIIINEIHADPSPPVNLPNAEFVELYNRSNKTIDLGGMIFNDGSDHVLPSFVLAPDSFVILTAAANVAGYTSYGNVLNVGSMALTNGGELLSFKNSSGQTIDSVDYDITWYQDVVKDDGGWTLELINPTLLCQVTTNWIASNDTKGGTPGKQNSVYSNIPDTQGPNLTTANFVDATHILLTFNEALGTNAGTVSNYTVTNATVTTALLSASNQVNLTLAAPMVDQTNYIVTVNGLTDCSGNSIAANTVDSFIYYQVQLATYQELIFTEVHADPSPVVGLPEAEFIEVYNRSNKTIDLGNYTLFESSNHTLPTQIMLPGTYAIICAASNQSNFTTYGTVVPINSLSLTNGGELIQLFNTNGVTLDSIEYSNDWYQDNVKDDGGWTLELINPNLLCKGGANWIVSNSSTGGTPGGQNSVYDNTVDNTAPAVLTTRQYGTNQILIEFDDVLNKNIAGSTANYAVDNGVNVVTVVCLSESEVILTLGANMTDQTIYTITLNNLEDCVGNIMGTTTTSMTYYEAGAASHYDLIINEIMADPNPPVGLPEKEYVEIYNRSNKTFNLENFKFTDASSVVSNLPFFILHPGEYVTLYSGGDTISFASFGNVLPVTPFPDLNTSDELILQDQAGEIIDAVAYEKSWYQNGDKESGGWSIERINPDRPCEGASNWRASENLLGGTPSAVNSILNVSPDVQSPDALRAFPLRADSIRVYFSEAVADIAGATVANYSIDNNINVVGARLEPPFFNSVILTLDQPLILGTTYTITMAASLTDCIGNPIALKNTVRLALPQAIQSGDLILNEILFNPVTNGKDFIELYNTSNKVLNTADLVLSNAEIIDGNLANASTLQTRPIVVDWLVFPNEYVVITSDVDQVRGQYHTPNPNWFVENNLPTYNEKEGHVFLYAAYDSAYIDNMGNPQTAYLAKVMDLFDYSDDFHSPLIDNKKGVSLERIDFDAPTNDANNWHSAATEVGYATPAYQNSSYLTNDIAGNDLIELPIETVSPDGDGYEDFLLINYNVDGLGYIANIDVYDATGRLVRNLVNGELLAREGALQWDGTDNKGRKARVGIHLLSIEIFRPDGTVRRFKKTCIVAGRME